MTVDKAQYPAIYKALIVAYREAQVHLAKAEEELNNAQGEVHGLELAMARYAPTPVTSPVLLREPKAGAVQGEWTELSKTDAIARCLNEAKEPLSPSEVVSRLAAAGRDENNDQVRAGLAYLKRLGRAQLLRRGQWVTTWPPAITNDSETTDMRAPSSVPEGDWCSGNVDNWLSVNQMLEGEE